MSRLFDAPAVKAPRWQGSTALAVRSPGCPECQTPLVTFSVEQPALFIHGGYGATKRITWTCCYHCRWTTESIVEEVRPAR